MTKNFCLTGVLHCKQSNTLFFAHPPKMATSMSPHDRKAIYVSEAFKMYVNIQCAFFDHLKKSNWLLKIIKEANHHKN